MADMEQEPTESGVDDATSSIAQLGEFPFKAKTGQGESRQVAWLRSHASYLNKGLVGYLSAIGLLVRGVIVNLVVIMPVLVAVALGVAAVSISGWGFGVAASLAVAVLIWVVLSPVLVRLRQVAMLRRTVTTGNESSANARSRWERSFGFLILMLGLAAAAEASSYFLDDFHFWTREREFGFSDLASVAVVAIPVLAAAGRLLPNLEGARQTVALAVTGLLGVLLPLLMVLLMADYLAFDVPGRAGANLVLIAGAGLWVIMVLIFVIGLFMSSAFGRNFYLTAIAGLLVALALLGVGTTVRDRSFYNDEKLDERLARFSFDAPTEQDVSLLDTAAQTLLGNPEESVAQEAAEELAEVAAAFDGEINRLASNAAARPPDVLSQLPDYLNEVRRIDGDSLLPLPVLSEQEILPLERAQLLAEIEQLYAMPAGFESSADLARGLHAYFTVNELAAEQAYTQWQLSIVELRSELERAGPIFLAEDGDLATLARVAMRDFNLAERASFLDALGRLCAVGDQPADAETGGGAAGCTNEAEEVDLTCHADTNVGTEAESDADVDAPSGNASEMCPPSQLATLVRTLPASGDSQPEGAAIIASAERLEANMTELVGRISGVRLELARVATSSSQYPNLRSNDSGLRWRTFSSSAIFATMLIVLLWAYGWLVVDPNRTSLHALYRDRLASTFLVGRDPARPERLRTEPDINLAELGQYELDSTAPYHLINCAVNLQSSRSLRTRGRQSDFFIFSKRFIGSEQTGFCRSITMDKVMPEMSVQMAMAISAAAAAPNMGRSTSKSLTAFMVFVNARLGQWIPNPGKLDTKHGSEREGGYSIDEVLAEERIDLKSRWANLHHHELAAPDASPAAAERTAADGVFGIAFSGGGIRSASLNLGIAQALEEHGVFQHIDYMSTVSGGGYLGAGISVGMRSVSPLRSPATGRVTVKNDPGQDITTISLHGTDETYGTYDYGSRVALMVNDGETVEAGARLVTADRWLTADNRKIDFDAGRGGEFGAQFKWRARPWTLFNEMTGRLHARGRSVNVSDGGHIENLGVFELLRRRCRFIIVGDAEMDPEHAFKGLAILIRTARVELGAEITIALDDLRLDVKGNCARHYAVGTITYRASATGEETTGTFLYFKSSITGTEPVDIAGYRAKNPAFPHQSTADQFFDEGQFESYRSLGYHMATDALELLPSDSKNPPGFSQVQAWFQRLVDQPRARDDSDTDSLSVAAGDSEA